MKNLFIFTLLTFLFFNNGVQAQTNPGLKLGYTNLDYILGQLPEAKQVESELKDYEKKLQEQLQNKYADYEKKLQDYQKASSSGLMTDVIKEDKEKEILSLQNSIKEFEQNAQTSLQKKQVSLLEPVLAKVQKAIDQVGEENGYTYIFSTHADYGGSAIILYAKNKEDNVSDIVLKKLGVTPAPVSKDANTNKDGGVAKPNPGTGTPNQGTAPVKPQGGESKETAPVKKKK